MWYNKYIGIPYVSKGRGTEGLDCWGLVRLVYSEQYNINLPSFSDEYLDDDRLRQQELISHYQEGWAKQDEPAEGDVIVFKILGTESHVGIYIGNGLFIHAREGVSAVVTESITNSTWAKRIVGYFKYVPSTNAVLTSAPHPLRTEHFTDQITPGTTALELIERIRAKYVVSSEIEANYHLMIDGAPVPESAWATTVIEAGQSIQYRAVAKGDSVRTILTIALIVVVAIYAPEIAAELSTSMGTAATASTVGAGYVAATSIALNIAGMALINMIAPVRQPDAGSAGNTATSAIRQNLYSGGSNAINKYGAIPVVLGKMRVTPPLGAQQYVDFTDPEKARLISLLTWGYGPLEIRDLQIGTNDLDNYVSYSQETLYGYADEDQQKFNDMYPGDVKQEVLNQRLLNVDPTVNINNLPDTALNPWIDVIIDQKCTDLSIALHFPEGMRQLITSGSGAGDVYEAYFTGTVQYRRLDDNLNAIEPWSAGGLNLTTPYKKVIPEVSYKNTAGVITNLYQWARVYIDGDGNIQTMLGAKTDNKDLEPSATLQQLYAQESYAGLVGTNKTRARLPTLPEGSVKLWDVCFYGKTGIVSTSDYRGALPSYTGFAVSAVSTTENITLTDVYGDTYTQTVYAGHALTIAVGSTTISNNYQNISLGGPDKYSKKKDAFTEVVKYSSLPYSKYQVRVRRTNYDTVDVSNNTRRNFNSCILYSVTGYSNRTRPSTNPPGCYIAKTVLNILSSDNVNGRLEGINGLVQSVCLDWNPTTKQWDTKRATSNPASLFLHVLTHPANAFKVNISENRINLATLGSWHEYCTAQGFEFNSIMDAQRGVLEILKDIAAAGRASPTLIDGKWTVVIDRPRDVLVQHFTPYNSWGFESSKRLPRQPDAFRVTFRNEEKSYTEDTILILNKGITEDKASLIEEISLPGVTNRNAAFKHGRWHLAQLALRPEVYTLNTDFEYLVCSRGDLVRVTHDVADWGTGSGRIKNFLSTTNLELDQPVYLEKGKSYNIRIRTAAGLSVLKSLVTIADTADYDHITLSQPLTALEGAAGNLFMLGEVGKESQELIVLTIESLGNTSARLTLVDYSPEIYSVDTATGGEYVIPKYDPNLTQLPEKLVDTILYTPQLDATTIKSDESVITRSGTGALVSNIRVPYSTPKELPKTVTYIETQYDYATSTSSTFQFKITIPVSAGSVTLPDTPDGTQYKIRARYLTNNGTLGPWSSTVLHTVIGKTSPPSSVTNFAGVIEARFGKVQLHWDSIPDIDLDSYEIRDTDTSWGNGSPLFKGLANSCFLEPSIAGATKNYYIKAVDVVGNYSKTATVFTLVVAKPAVPVVNTSSFFNATSLTSTAVRFTWAPGTYATGSLNVASYELEFSYTDPTIATITTVVNAQEWESTVNWNGTAKFRIRSIDIAGNKSDFSAYVSVSKAYPAVPANPTITVANTNIELDWVDTARTSLPVLGYEIRTADENWGLAGAEWKGSASNAVINLLGKTAGTYTWYLRAYDSDGKYSQSSRVITYTITAPSAPVIGDPVFQDTSLTNATVTLSWTHVKPLFGLYGYEVTYGSTVVITKANTITIPANWVGDKSIYVKTIDNLVTDTTSNMSAASGKTITVLKPNPIPQSSVKAQVIDNTILLYWSLPNVTTLPIAQTRIKRTTSATTNPSWATAELVGDKSGTFTSFSELSKGTYTYWMAAVDTEDNESDAISITTEISQPPNFVFNAEYISEFAGTKTNAVVEANTGKLVLPVNTTETWSQHFSSHSWASPSAQVAAGYPIFIQPGLTTGSYQETFDYLSVLASSQVTLNLGTTQVAGTSVITHVISTSMDNVTWTDFPDSNSVFATNFRYVKVKVNITQGTAGSICRIDSLGVRLDSKQKSDSGSVIAKYSTSPNTDLTGTIVNFAQEFIDVISITANANSTLPMIAVCDFLDTPKTGTYSIVSNLCTVTIPTDANGVAHNLLAGQKVRVFFTTGTAPSGVYTVVSATTNTYTLAVTSANTSGNINTYPNSMRVYVYDQNGIRQNNVQVSWQVQGY